MVNFDQTFQEAKYVSQKNQTFLTSFKSPIQGKGYM